MKKLVVYLCLMFVFSTVQFVFAQEDKKETIPTPLPSDVSISVSPADSSSVNSTPNSLDWADTPDSGRDRDFSKKMQRRIVLTIVALLIISVLVYFVIKYLSSNKVNIPFLGLGQQSAMIKVVDRHMLAPNRALYLVNVVGKYILLGSAENNLNFLCEVPCEDIEKFNDKKEQEIKNRLEPEKAPFDFFSDTKKT